MRTNTRLAPSINKGSLWSNPCTRGWVSQIQGSSPSSFSIHSHLFLAAWPVPAVCGERMVVGDRLVGQSGSPVWSWWLTFWTRDEKKCNRMGSFLSVFLTHPQFCHLSRCPQGLPSWSGNRSLLQKAGPGVPTRTHLFPDWQSHPSSSLYLVSSGST